MAAKVHEADGEAVVWVATPSTKRNSADLAQQMTEARNDEYAELLAEIEQLADAADARTIARWRRQWRRIDRRDFFRAPLRDAARIELAALASRSRAGVPAGDTSEVDR